MSPSQCEVSHGRPRPSHLRRSRQSPGRPCHGPHGPGPRHRESALTRRPARRPPGQRFLWRSAAAVAALLTLAACGHGGGGTAAPGSGQLPPVSSQSQAAEANPALDAGTPLGGTPAPNFRLMNQFGQPMSLQQFRGKVVILAFLDSQCTTVCPLTSVSMLEAKELLGSAGSQVQLLGVDANPEATKVSDVMAYSRAHGMVNHWDYLTGTRAQLKSVWKSYHIAVEIQRGLIDHTPALYVIDRHGGERAIYLTQMNYASVGQQAQILAQKAASLLPGHPHLASQRSLSHIPGLGPSSRVTLKTLPSGSVTLGPGHPRLVVFFATWLAEVSPLRSELLALNRYQAAARGGKLPPLVAVDETVTEQSAAAVASYLKGLGKALAYPVGLDTSGRVADGYGVQDQPWFALVSASGKVIWHHDGWLPVSALQAAARKA